MGAVLVGWLTRCGSTSFQGSLVAPRLSGGLKSVLLTQGSLDAGEAKWSLQELISWWVVWLEPKGWGANWLGLRWA